MLQRPGDASASTDPLSDALARLDTQRVKKGDLDTRERMGGLPPRQSSDSTLHPLPSGGRPSSAPSCRSSFDSVSDGAMSDPSRSERGSFEQEGKPAAQPAAADVPLPRRPCAAVTQCAAAEEAAPQQPSQPPPAQQQWDYHQTSLLHAPDEQAAGQQQPRLVVRPRAPEPEPSPFGQALEPFPQLHQLHTPHGTQQQQQQQQERLSLQLGGLSPGGAHRTQRRSTGKHPANLEHGSTAPPGAIDELAELLLAAAGRSKSGNGGHVGSNANSAAAGNVAAALLSAVGGRSSGGGGSGSAAAALVDAASGLAGGTHGAQPRATAATRGSMPRRSASAAPVGGGHAEPLLSSQVALLAQQLLLQQQQHSGSSPGGRNAAAQLRQQALHLPRDRGQTAVQEPVRNSGGRPAGFGSAAEMLRGGSGGGGGGQLCHPSPTAASTLQGLDPACQPRFSSPTPMEMSEAVSPFSSIQGVYGCHLVPPVDPANPSPEASPSLTSRSSIDLLLDPAVPATVHTHRHSLDTLSELLHSTPLSANAGSPVTMVTQILQRMGHHSNSNSNSNSNAGGHSSLRTRHVVTVRHSMDSGGAGPGANRHMVARTLSTLPGGRSRDRVVDAAASYYGHVSSSAMHDMANSTVTVVAGALPVGPAAQTSRTSVSAHASSMVDPAAQPVAGTFEAARVGTPEESMLDPDLHDTFGAHPSNGMPTVRPRPRLSPNGGSRGPVGDAIALLSRATGGGSSSAATPVSMVTDGWRQPMAVPRRPPLPRSVGASPLNASPTDPPTPAAAAAAAATNGGTGGKPPLHHPTVYQPHKSPLPAVSSVSDFSPIGNAMMLDPTNVPGQHSITVHDPQYSIPSLPFLRQCALARKKMERQESASASRGGYIAEAKRVLAAAVHTATAQEAAVVESSCSGAIGPLLRYLRDNKHNDSALRSGLHTLSLLVTNSPNRGIIVSFHGQAMLCEAMRATQDIELRENCVQLLWDLEALNKECHFDPEDILALQSVLEGTSNACIASHILHLLYHCLGRHDAPDMSPEQMQLCAQRLVDEIAAHKHHLQDAAQYALGNLMAVVLGDIRLAPAQRLKHVSRLLDELRKTNAPGQCQVVLTVLSCIAGNARVRSSMAHCQARRRLMEFGQHIPDPRLRARSLSLIKILHKQEMLEGQGGGSWYFGAAAGTSTASEASGSPRCEPSR